MVSSGAVAIGTQQAEVQSQNIDDVSIDEELAELMETEDTVEVVVRLESGTGELDVSGDRMQVRNELQSQAEQTQQPLLGWAENQDSIEVLNTFWISNSVLLEVQRDESALDDIAAQPNIDRLHPNYEFSVPETEETDVTGENAVTYGLEQMNVTRVWDDLGVTGAGAEVAILDTGVDADHPDFASFDSDNWAEFDEHGDRVASEPHDDDGHGTHVSGTVVGPENPDGDVPAYGVAPDANLWHGKVLNSDSHGTFTQVQAGMEWVVEETDAHVVGMSLGTDGTATDLIEASENIRDAGIIFTASVGNSGNGESGSPGNYYSSFASGAIDQNYERASFSGGELVDTRSTWGSEAPAHWSAQYQVPNAAAAGVSVLSAEAGGGYAEYSGTSMSQPHKAGVFALMVSAAGEVDREHFWEVVEETAWQPDDTLDNPNTEYGHGIVDAFEATSRVGLNQYVRGQVTDTTGNGIGDATITIDNPGTSTTTDEDGFYEVPASAGSVTVTVEAFGYVEQSEQVTVTDDGIQRQDFELETALDVDSITEQQEKIESGESITAAFESANADSLTVEQTGDIDAAHLTLEVAGEEATFGEMVELGGVEDEFEIAVQTERGVDGTVELHHTFEGGGDQRTVTTGTTQVFESVLRAAVIDDTEGYGAEWVAHLDAYLPEIYRVEHVSSDDALQDIDAYDTYFVHGLHPDVVDDWFASTDDTNTVYTELFNGPTTLSDRSTAIGEPREVRQDFGLHYWDVETEHAIFEGVADPGDRILVHNAPLRGGGSFSETSATPLAQANDGDHAIAIDESRQDILLTSIGLSNFTEGELQEDALQVTANSVSYTYNPTSEYANNEGVVDTDGIRRAIDDWRGGHVDIDVLRTVIEYWRSGDPVQ